MSKMKYSGVEWIGNIPWNWKLKKIKYIYNMQTGFTPDTTRDDYYSLEQKNIWVSIADIAKLNGKYIKDSSNYISDLYIKEKKPKLVKKDSLLYSFKLSVGKTAFAGKDLYTNEAIVSFEDSDNICLHYLNYASFLIEYNSNKNIYNALILNKELIKNSVTIVPSLKEQKLIANFLDEKIYKLDEILDDLSKQIEILKNYKNSIISEKVTRGLNPKIKYKNSEVEWIGDIPEHWNCKKIKYMTIGGLVYGANESGVEFSELLPRYIRITDIDENNRLKDDDKQSLLPENAKDYLLENDDILFARSGATVGKTFLYKSEYGKAAFAGYLIKATINKNIAIPKYVYYSTLGNGYENWKNSIFTQSTIQNINADKYSNYKLTLPPIEEQKQIVEYLDRKCEQIDKIIDEKQKQIKKIEEYKKSVIYEYSTGKKRVEGAEELYG